MSEYAHQFTKAVAEAESVAQASEKKRLPTVRFTVEEAALIQEAMNYYFGPLKETENSPTIHKVEQRLKKFIEKHSVKEAN